MAKKQSKRIKDLKETFKIIRLSAFLENYTDINPKGGIYPRLNGKSTSVNDKQNTLRDEEKEKLRNSLLELSDDLIAISKCLELKIKEDEKV